VLLALALGYLMLLILVVLLEDFLLYHPARAGEVTADGDDVWLHTADGVTLHARYTHRDRSLPTLLYLHGTAGNLASRSDRLALFANLGANLLALDYRGYGKSGGTPSERGLYLDARAAHDWLSKRTEARKIVLFGQSLGGGAACELATTRPIGGLILLSTFTSTPEIAAHWLPFLPMRQLLHTRFDNLSKVARVKVPKLFIHSRRDQVVPFGMAEQLFAAAALPKQQLWLTRSNHDGTFYTERALAVAAMQEFLRMLH
jgi:fermentation-respiration switch protein FrsA (DUF1100 family)